MGAACWELPLLSLCPLPTHVASGLGFCPQPLPPAPTPRPKQKVSSVSLFYQAPRLTRTALAALSLKDTSGLPNWAFEAPHTSPSPCVTPTTTPPVACAPAWPAHPLSLRDPD